MADIDIERKRGIPWWVWLLALLLVALLVWLLLGAMDDDDDVETVDPAAPTVVAPADSPVVAGAAAAATVPQVQQFTTQCTAQGAQPAGDMGREHEFTVNCLQQLREAMLALDSQTPGSPANQQIIQYGESLEQLRTSDPSAATHASQTREAAMTAAQIMQSMSTQASAAAQAAVGRVNDAAGSITSGTAMLEQREAVHGFFREAGEALRVLAQGAGTTAPGM